MSHPQLMNTSRQWFLPAGLASLALIACGSGDRTEAGPEPAEATTGPPSEQVSVRQSGLDRAPILPAAGGEYTPGWFTGECRKADRPEELSIGMTYDVVAVYTQFFVWEDGEWIGDGRVSQPFLQPGNEYVCTPERDRTTLPGRFRLPNEYPARYQAVTSGYIIRWEVRQCPTVGGGPCPYEISREEVRNEFEFTLTRGQ